MHVECTNDDAVRTDQLRNLEVNMPMYPSPEFVAVPNRRIRVLPQVSM